MHNNYLYFYVQNGTMLVHEQIDPDKTTDCTNYFHNNYNKIIHYDFINWSANDSHNELQSPMLSWQDKHVFRKLKGK